MYHRPLTFKQVTLSETQYKVIGNPNPSSNIHNVHCYSEPLICVSYGHDNDMTNALKVSPNLIHIILDESNNAIDMLTCGCVSKPSSVEKLYTEPIIKVPDATADEIVLGSSIINIMKMTFDDMHNSTMYIKELLYKKRFDKYIEYELAVRARGHGEYSHIIEATEDPKEAEARLNYFLQYNYSVTMLIYKDLYILLHNTMEPYEFRIDIENWLKRNEIDWIPPRKERAKRTTQSTYINTHKDHVTPVSQLIASATEYWDRAVKYKNARIFPFRMFPRENTTQLYDFSAYTTLTSLPVYLQDEPQDASIPDFLYPTLAFPYKVERLYLNMARAFMPETSQIEQVCITLSSRWNYMTYNDYAMFRCWYMELVYGRKFKFNYAPLIDIDELTNLDNLKNPIFFRPAPLLVGRNCKVPRKGLITNKSVILQRFNQFTDNMFLNADLHDVRFVGSIVDYCLIEGADAYKESYMNSDIDIMVSGVNRYVEVIYACLHAFDPAYTIETIYFANSSRFKYKFSAPNRKTVELFSANKMQTLGYHVPCVRGVLEFGYDNMFSVYVSPSLICTAVTGIIPEYRWVKVDNEAKNIIAKYINRGYKFMPSPSEMKELMDGDLNNDFVVVDFPKELAEHSIIDNDGNIIHPCDKGLWER